MAGLRSAAELLAAAGQPKASHDAANLAARVAGTVEATFTAAVAPEAVQALPADEDAAADAKPDGVVLLDPAHAASAPDSLLTNLTLFGDPAVHHGRVDPDAADQRPHEAARLAVAELLAGDPRCLERLQTLLDAASPTWTWTRDVHAESQSETVNVEYHALAAARLLQLVRLLLVRETWGTAGEPDADQTAPDGAAEHGTGLAIATLVPETWLGQGWEVHDAPTTYGRLSYAVRWHGERPALLWQLQPHRHGDGRSEEDPSKATEGVGTRVRLTAPGLDPTWSSTDPAGEALLQECCSG